MSSFFTNNHKKKRIGKWFGGCGCLLILEIFLLLGFFLYAGLWGNQNDTKISTIFGFLCLGLSIPVIILTLGGVYFGFFKAITGPNPVKDTSTKDMAIGGLLCAALSLGPYCCAGILGFILAIPLSLLSIVLSIIVLIQIKKNPGQQGKGMAIASLIIAVFGVIGGVLMLIFYVLK